MIVDIFIKTYYKDFIWLEYLLKSIKKFASGFRNVVIVSDEGHLLPPHFHDILPFTIIYVKVPTTPLPMEHGIGYAWQQCVKLTWYKYTNADHVVVFDSDNMLTRPTTPESFKTNGKYNWYYRPWKDAGNGIVHKPNVDKILNYNTVYDSMCCTVFCFTKSSTAQLERYLHQRYGTSNLWVIMHKLRIISVSEFNIYGNFIHTIQHPDYHYVYDLSNIFNSTILQSWSWGGLKNDDKEKRMKILDSVEII
jgi:hypothetical protein